MTMSPRLRKFSLATHLTVSVGWIGAVVAYVALGVAASNSSDAVTVRGAWMAMELTGWYVIVPMAVASLVTGLIMALGTRWGLFRHYWVLLSLVLTAVAVLVLVLHMPTVSSMADLARQAEDPAALDALGGDLFHSVLGLVLLLVIQVLNVFKPRGLTRYGRRRSPASNASGSSRPSAGGEGSSSSGIRRTIGKATVEATAGRSASPPGQPQGPGGRPPGRAGPIPGVGC